MNKIKCLVIEVAEGEFQGNPWQQIIGRVDGKLMKFKVDLKQVKFTKADVDQDYSLEYEIYGSLQSPATVRITGKE